MVLAIPADKLKGGDLQSKPKEILKWGSGFLRAYWFTVGIYYLIKYFRNRDWFSDKSNLIHSALKYFGPPILVIAACWVYIYFRRWPVATITCRKHYPSHHWEKLATKIRQRRASTQWAFYATQWGLFLSQCWVFARTITPCFLNANLREIFVGKKWHLFSFIGEIFKQLWYHLWHWSKSNQGSNVNFPRGGIYFVFFILLIFAIFIRNVYRFRQIQTDKTRQTHLIISTLCILGILFYLSILSFAHVVYPFIPAAKGGGDYTESLPVHIVFSSNSELYGNVASTIPPEIKTNLDAHRMIMLDENNSFVFLAKTNDPDTNGPAGWRNGNKPKVYEIRRDAILSITYFNPVATNSVISTKLTSTARLAP